MKFLEKLSAKAADKTGKAPVTIAFLGDSVTQGCFEVYETGNGGLDTVYEPESGYPAKTVSILQCVSRNYTDNLIFPSSSEVHLHHY